jgi:hypothetical protein
MEATKMLEKLSTWIIFLSLVKNKTHPKIKERKKQ